MKYTGWAVLIVGVLIGVYGLFASIPPDPNLASPAQAPSAAQAFPISFGTVVLGFSALAIAGGVGILLLGGRGVIKTKNLAVRN